MEKRKKKYIEKMNKKKEAPARHNDVDSGSSGKKCHSTQTLAFFGLFLFGSLDINSLAKNGHGEWVQGYGIFSIFHSPAKG